MRRYLRSHRAKNKPRGTALAIAMLVVVLLSGVGMVALSAASHDLASAGAVRQGSDAEAVAEGGLALARCEMCRTIDGVVMGMQSMRQTRGQSPQFNFERSTLESRLDGGGTTFDQPSGGERGSFGRVGDPTLPEPPVPEFAVTVDRPRETAAIAGYSLREAAGSDSSSFCFRNYRVTSTGTYQPFGGAASPATRAKQRAFIVAGPLECTM